jgi:hypothetical protein
MLGTPAVGGEQPGPASSRAIPHRRGPLPVAPMPRTPPQHTPRRNTPWVMALRELAGPVVSRQVRQSPGERSRAPGRNAAHCPGRPLQPQPEIRTIEGAARRGTGTAPSGRLSRTEGQAMPIRWRTREYERTCDDCGHVWRVPRWAAPPLYVQGRPVSGGCERGVPPPAAAVMADPAVATTAQLAERAAVFFRAAVSAAQSVTSSGPSGPGPMTRPARQRVTA